MTDETYAEIDALVKQGDVVEAAARLSAVLAADPDDDEAQMLYGTCAQLLGEDAEFGRIHAALQPKMDAVAAYGEQSRRTALWEKYKALAGKLALPCAMVASSVILCGCYGCPPMDPEYRQARDARVVPAAPAAPKPAAEAKKPVEAPKDAAASHGGAPVPGAQDAKKPAVPAGGAPVPGAQ